MSFNPSGKPLTIEMKFGGNNFAVCIFKFRVGSDPWTNVQGKFNNKIANQNFNLDPTKLIGPGKTIEDFSGCSVGWFYVADEPGQTPPNTSIPYSFDLDIFQGATNKLFTFSVNGNDVPPILRSSLFTF